MIRVEKKLIDEERELSVQDRLVMTYEQRKKGRILVQSENGQEYGLFLERGKVLAAGDLLEAEDGAVLEVVAQDEALLEGHSHEWTDFAKCCYHLGNRHVPVEINERTLRIQSDHILKEMLEQLGMDVADLEAPFNPEPGAYSGGHQHEH